MSRDAVSKETGRLLRQARRLRGQYVRRSSTCQTLRLSPQPVSDVSKALPVRNVIDGMPRRGASEGVGVPAVEAGETDRPLAEEDLDRVEVNVNPRTAGACGAAAALPDRAGGEGPRRLGPPMRGEAPRCLGGGPSRRRGKRDEREAAAVHAVASEGTDCHPCKRETPPLGSASLISRSSDQEAGGTGGPGLLPR